MPDLQDFIRRDGGGGGSAYFCCFFVYYYVCSMRKILSEHDRMKILRPVNYRDVAYYNNYIIM